mgnify:CR=1 FL=1|tara:strand:+ start:96 stop:389 length:294 start_codon:yes stop_codon:yes gene_type:complete
MPFKSKPTTIVGRADWAVEVPKPPKHATHARIVLDSEFMENGKPKTATLPIEDFGCFKGVSGDFSYLRMNKSRKIQEEYEGSWYWDGTRVEGIENLK